MGRTGCLEGKRLERLSIARPLGLVNSPVPVERLSQGLSNHSYRTAGSYNSY